MATSAYHRWDDDGRPWKLARPVKALGERLRAHGYVVYFLGDQGHLTSDFPEDHSPYSSSPWPGRHPYPYVLALDVMPPKRGQRSKVDGKPLPSLQTLGRQIRDDKLTRTRAAAWIKFMNWEPQGNYTGPCWHESWQPNHHRRPSGDRGHIHLSCRTDFHTSSVADNYDPVARIRAASTPPPEDDMPLTDKDAPVIQDAVHNTPIGRTGTTFAKVLSSLRIVPAKLDIILAAVAGDDVAEQVAALAARVEQLAAADATRDAELAALVQQGQDGTLDAAEVVRLIGEKLTADAAPPTA